MCFPNSAGPMLATRSCDDTGMVHGSDLTATIDLWETVVTDMTASIQSVVLVSSGKNPTSIEIESDGELKIGRSSDLSGCVVADKMMSREHFSITCRADRVVLRDLDSTNGTRLNGHVVKEASIYDGDEITAGATTFTVHLRSM